MRARNLVVCIALLAVSLLAGRAIGQAADPWIGTWKLNVAASKYSPGPAPKSSTLMIAATSGGLKQTTDTVPATGAATHAEITFNMDGKDYPVKGNPNVDTQSFKKIDARSYEVTAKKGGKVTTTTRVSYSADGKARTATQTGTTPDGKPLNNTLSYNRQ